MQNASAIIYLSEQRGLIEKPGSNCFCTLNYQEYFNEYKQAFGSIFLFNDLILSSQSCSTTILEQDCYFIIIPITGSLHYRMGNHPYKILEVGEALMSSCQQGNSIDFCNPYLDENIQLIQIGIKADVHLARQKKFPIDLTSKPNKLIQIASIRSRFKLSAGRFGGRKEFSYPLKQNSCHFIFALYGAFEVSGRLLHPGDSLALWNTDRTDIEALSNNAVIFCIETEAPLPAEGKNFPYTRE